MRFADLPGYAEIKTTLVAMGSSERIPHALLFTGAPGAPVVPLMLGFAQFLYCQQKGDDDACGRCHGCQTVEKLVHPDMQLLFPVSGSETDAGGDDAAGERLLGPFRAFIKAQPFGSVADWAASYGAANRQPGISVKEVRRLIGNLSLKSYEGGYKVAIIWLPELMNVSGANALLKILEEPPEKTLFLLATYSQDALLATILSRVIQIRVRPAEDAEIAKVLEMHGIGQAEASQAILGAEGSFARALELARHEDTGLQPSLLAWMRACFSLNYPTLAQQSEEFAKLGREGQKWRVSYALSVFRRLLRHKVHPASGATEEQVALAKFFDAVAIESIEPAVDQLEHLYDGVVRNAAPKLAYLSASIKLGHALRYPQHMQRA